MPKHPVGEPLQFGKMNFMFTSLGLKGLRTSIHLGAPHWGVGITDDAFTFLLDSLKDVGEMYDARP